MWVWLSSLYGWDITPEALHSAGCGALLTTPAYRYVPIEEVQTIGMAVNQSQQHLAGNTTPSGGILQIRGPAPFDIAQVVALTAFIALILASLLYIASITALTRPPRGKAEVGRVRSEDMGAGYRVSYSYPGVKRILRAVYVSIRRGSCPTCTPRELALRGYAPTQFADLYEEVVYGGVGVDNVEERLARMGLELDRGEGGDA